jgi:hypothetical protein
VSDNGSAQGIHGTVTLTNAASYDQVTIDDSASAANRNVTLGVIADPFDGKPMASVTGLAPGVINFKANDVNSATVKGGSGADVYTVTGTPTRLANGYGGPTITLNTGAGADTVNVLGLGNGTGLVVNGQADDDTLKVDFSSNAIPLSSNISFTGGASGPAGNKLHLKGAAGDTFTMTAGSISRGGTGLLTYADVDQLFCETGTFNVNGDLNLPVLVAQSASTDVRFNASQTIGNLYVDAAHVALAGGGGNVLALRALNITNNGVLDLADNAMIVDYDGLSPLSPIKSLLTSGYAGGAWNGAGINSSVAAATPQHALGYAEAAAMFQSFPATFAGRSVDNSAVLVRYTRYGDANLDGAVNLQDFNRLAGSFGSGGTVWSQGNFNYDGLTSLSDFNLLAGNFGMSAGPAAARGVGSRLIDEHETA